MSSLLARAQRVRFGFSEPRRPSASASGAKSKKR
jgi:hypothetical protein